MDREIAEVQRLATKYSKNELGRMVQMGLLDPQKAMMAGMMIDRIQKQNAQPPQSTVAQDVLGMPGMQQRAQAAPQAAGLETLPAENIGEYAGGGIVAFADGGDIPGYADGNLVSASDTFRRGLASLPAEAPAAPVPAAPARMPLKPLDLPGGLRFQEYQGIAPTDIKAELAREQEALRLAGVDPDKLYKTLREDEAARREELKQRRQEAKGEAFLMAGLGLFGARQGQEAEALSTAGRQAMMQYGNSLREIRENEKDIKKAERELMIAEDRAKRDMSAKALGRVDARTKELNELQVRQTDQYNDTVKTLAKIISDEKRVDMETATRMAVAEIERRTRLEVESMQQRGANARAGMGETSILAERVLADLRKTNPNATLGEAIGIVRGGAGVSNAALADKAYDNVMKRLDKDFKLQAEIAKDPAALTRAIEAETRRLQTGGAGVTGGGGGGLSVGQVVDGYKFKGGNPNDKNSWEQVK